jgi:hypothetical protein
METKEMIALAKTKGITIKKLSEITQINLKTLYNYNCGFSNLSKEKEEKIINTLSFLLDR